MRQIESGLIFLLYWLARILTVPLLLVYFLHRGYRTRGYFRCFAERLGILPASFQRTPPGAIWLHAVSVGEVISSVRLIEELRTRNPEIPLYVSTATLAGRAVAEQKLAALVDGIFYAPLDYALAVRRVLRRIRPAVVAVLETEIWPVLYREAKKAHCGLLILNGRISDRTAGRYRSMRWLFRSILELPDAIYVQTDRERIRYLDAGAPAHILHVGGNLKYDSGTSQLAPPDLITGLIARLRPSAVWIAASTMPGIDSADVDEDDAVLRSFCELAQTHPGLLLILAPRRPERFAPVDQKLRALPVRFARRSDQHSDLDFSLPGVLLLDTIGELASIFPLADAVFMGGTLARRGGHNVLEPAACGKPIIAGPHMENFAAIADEFRAEQAWVQIRSAQELTAAVRRLLDDSALRGDLGARAAALARKQTGAAARFAQVVLSAQDCAIPDWNRSGAARPILWPVSLLWRWGGYLKRQADGARLRTLQTPVISVGGIALGGSGKTPFVEMLARELSAQNRRPAILTRGYRRRSLEQSIVVEAGSSARCALTGDEAQIFVRSGSAHVGIGANRWSTGRLVEDRLHPDVFLLDDGFQHRKLARQLDIVLLDALNPFPGGAAFPLGFLREPLESLRRADLFVITRAQPNRRYEGIRARLRSVNPAAPVLTATVEPRHWMNAKTRRRICRLEQRVAAFCGLGAPRAFWQTLAKLKIDPVFTWAFADHHYYRPRELRRLAQQARSQGARVLITTEKDAMNLPENALDLLAEVDPALDLYWLKIATVVQEERELMEVIGTAIQPH